MRVFFVVGGLAACTQGPGPIEPPPTSDRTTGVDDTSTTPDDTAPEPPPGFLLTTPDVEVLAGEEATWCYSFRTPNAEPLAIRRWQAHLSAAVHDAFLFRADVDRAAPGTLSTEGCGFQVGPSTEWLFAARVPDEDLEFPDDDGTGLPLAQELPADSPAYLVMHVLNPSDQTMQAHVTLEATALASGAAHTRTASFTGSNVSLSIPPGTPGHEESRTCSVPEGASFWWLSTHAHKQATHTQIRDQVAEVFASDDWEDPGAAQFSTPSTFFGFTSNQMTWACTYANATNRTIQSGESPVTDEMCTALGYYFPASGALFCVDNAGPF